MNSVITTYRDSYILGWHAALQVEIFGPDADKLDLRLQEIRNEISSRRSNELKMLRDKRAALRWWQIIKKEKIDVEIRLSEAGRWSEDWLVNIHFRCDVLLREKFVMVSKTVTKDGPTTVTIEKWEKA